jgi:RNA polymerase sigma-70 factor (ECF subfamily)
VDVKQVDDVALMHLISQGQDSALAELYDRYGRLVYSVTYRVVGSSQTAEETTLDVFTRAWEKGHTYDSAKSKVSTWLMRLARNRAIDQLRREGVRPEKDSIGWSEITAVPVTDSHNPEVQTALTLQQEKVRQALASLPKNQQEALSLAYFKGMSHREIAHTLEEPLGTVKGRIRTGMKALKRILIENEQ